MIQFAEAVFPGRFQPPHARHMVSLLNAMEHCAFLWIGITNPFPELCKVAGPHERDRTWNNPLSYHERVRLLRFALLEVGVAGSDFAFVPFPIEEPDQLERYLPPSIPCLTSSNTSWRAEKRARLIARGYRVVELTPPSADGVTGSRLRDDIMHDRAGWQAHVPQSVVAELERLGVRARLRALNPSWGPPNDAAPPERATASLSVRVPIDLDRLVTSEDDVVFTTGAQTEKLANASSDVDVVGAYGDGVPVSGMSLLTIVDQAAWGYSCVDFRALRRSALEALVDRLNAIDHDDARAVRGLELGDLDLYYRVASGTPLFNASGFASLRASFRIEVVSRLFRTWSGMRAADALRAAGAAPERSAALFARDALDSALDMHLAACGDAMPTLKWRFEKLARVYGQDSALYRMAWNLKGRSDAVAADRYVAEVYALCRTLGTDPFMAERYADRIPVRSPHARLFTVGEDNWLVHRRVDVYALDEPARMLWDLIDGSADHHTVIDRYGAQRALPREVAADHVAAFMDELRTRRLISGAASCTFSRRRPEGEMRPMPSLTAVDRAAGEVALRTAEAFAVFSRHYEIARMNAEAGIEAGQVGLTFTRSRDAVVHGVDAHLAAHGRRAADAVTALRCIGELHGRAGETHRALAALLSENPQSAADVASYAGRCFAFVEETLAMRSWRRYGGRRTQREYDRRWATLHALAAMTGHLGVPGPYSCDELFAADRSAAFFVRRTGD
jgi:nicotinamide mononucleotide adenylyltransferase